MPEKSIVWAQRARFEGKGPRYGKAGRKPLYPADAVQQWLMATERSNTIEPQVNLRAI